MVSAISADRARRKFLATLAETCNVSASARAAGIDRQTAYNWRDADEAFAAAWEQAVETAADKLEETAWDRATIDKSDRMLEILLKAHRPHKFVERRELSGPGGGPVQAAVSITFHKTDAADTDRPA